MSGGKRRPSSVGEYRLLLRVLAVVSVVRTLLPWVRLKRLAGWLAPSGSAPTPHAVSLQTVAWYTDALLQRMPGSGRGSCLPRSLTLFCFASRAGLPVRIHCGVRRTGPQLEGHAWLTLGGQPFLERGDPTTSYSITFSYPDAMPPDSAAESLVYRNGPSGALS